MPRGENRPSVLLSSDENDQVFSLIGPKCQSLATAVVQLFTTEGPAHSEWKKKDTGVLCLIKDNARRSYFFRIYCLYRKSMIWEHEVYMQIEYKSPRPYLHTFEAEEYMTAFNFANEDEARILRKTLIDKIELRKQRREERRNKSSQGPRVNSGSSYTSGGHAARQNGVTHAPPPAPALAPPPVPKSNLAGGGYTLKASGKKKPTRKLTKADIGMPQDFKHISHVGWDANKGFDVENLPEEEMRSFLCKAGVSETQLQDQATREFIYEFINTHGGLDAVKEELHERKPGTVSLSERAGAPPAPPAPPVPARSPAPHHPPAPPSRAPPPPPARVVPPPPPAAAPPPPRNPPPPRPLQPPSAAPPGPPPPPPAPGPAPPPPPPPALAPPPPPPPAAPAAPHAPDPRALLMESIRSGNKTLKHVEVGAKSVPEDNRSNLLSEIRQGVELRAVSRSTSNSDSSAARAVAGGDGLAGALARALQERNRAIHSSDESDSDATTSNDEWDD